MISTIAILLGAKTFAKLFGIKNLSTSWWFVIVPPIVLALIHSMFPHQPVHVSEIEFDGSNAFVLISTWTAVLGAAYIWQIKRLAGVQYTAALAWLIFTLGFMALSGIWHLIFVLIVNEENWLLETGSLLGHIPSGLSFLCSAYAFNRITAGGDTTLRTFTARNFFGRPLRATAASSEATSINIVTYAANLASNPRAIDPLLDPLRAITSGLSPGQKPSEAEEATLRSIYLDIEEYLVHTETVRSFTRESLRQTIADGLRLTEGNQGFFDRLDDRRKV